MISMFTSDEKVSNLDTLIFIKFRQKIDNSSNKYVDGSSLPQTRAAAEFHS